MKKITDKEIFGRIRKHWDILEKHGVKRIGLFGSYARGEQKRDSDIDFMVEFEKPDFDNFMDMVFYLEDLFGKNVELVTKAGLSPYIGPYVEKEIRWYEKEPAVS